MSETPSEGVAPRLSLTMRTSLFCEFRDRSGVLQAFEICEGQTTFGLLCNSLLRLPGVEFQNHDPQSWFRRPARFIYGDQLFEVSIPHGNIRVAPVELPHTSPAVAEILDHVRRNVLRSRAARYTVR
jgi:hypothetical protein